MSSVVSIPPHCLPGLDPMLIHTYDLEVGVFWTAHDQLRAQLLIGFE